MSDFRPYDIDFCLRAATHFWTTKTKFLGLMEISVLKGACNTRPCSLLPNELWHSSGCSRTPISLRFVSLSASFGLFTLLDTILFPSPMALPCLGHCSCLLWDRRQRHERRHLVSLSYELKVKARFDRNSGPTGGTQNIECWGGPH